MKNIIILATLFILTILNGLEINQEALTKAVEQKLHTTNITLSLSKHGGDNKVFFIKNKDTILGIAKCYTKRNIQQVEETYKISQLLCKELPVPNTINIFLFNGNIPVVLQEFLMGKHYECLNSKQLHEVAISMSKIHVIKSDSKALNKNEFDYGELFELCKSFPDYDFILKLYRNLNLNYLNGLPLSYIHGDISGSNILFNDGKISGIIDLDHARYSHRLTDIARSQVFFSFDNDGKLNEGKIHDFIKNYHKINNLHSNEFKYFYDHLKLLLIKMTLETYYYVEVKKEVSPEIFKQSTFNQSWQLLLKKLHSISDKSGIVI